MVCYFLPPRCLHCGEMLRSIKQTCACEKNKAIVLSGR